VPFLITPMSNFVEFTIRLQNKKPRPIDFLAESPCGAAYVDARSILRGIRPDRRDGSFFAYGMKFVSHTENGQLMVLVNKRRQQTSETLLLESIRDAFEERESEVVIGLPSRIRSTPGRRYVLFSERRCSLQTNGHELPSSRALIRAAWTGVPRETTIAVAPHCSPGLAGWAQTTLPPYMGL
jgi:hypothetical protein